jgi:hypothetical protein
MRSNNKGSKATVIGCQLCRTENEDGASICTACGAALASNGSRPEAVASPFTLLLADNRNFQRELLQQIRDSQSLQARVFQRALQIQAGQLEKTLGYALQTQSTEQRIQFWQRLAVGLAAAVVVLFIVAAQLAA